MKTRKIQKIEYYETCPKCGNDIKGVSESQAKWNFEVHKKTCKGGEKNVKKTQ